MKLADKDWRLRHLYYIVNKDGQKVLFNPNSLQDIVNKTPDPRKVLLKSRQIGFSTQEILKMFDFTIFGRNRTSCILAHENDAIEKLFRIVQRAYKWMPEELKPKLDRGGGSKHEFYFPEINSRIYCDLESRGDTIQWLHVSEFAFMKDAAKVKSTLQAVPLNGIATIETTPNGMGNHFYDMWIDQDQPYKKLFFPWYMFEAYRVPAKKTLEYTDEELELIAKAKKLYGVEVDQEQIAFRRLKKAELKDNAYDENRVPFEQEYPEDDATCFLSSGNSVMDAFIIKALIDKAFPPEENNGWMRLYAKPDKTKTYVCGADVAEGVGGDYSVGVMIEIQSRKVVGIIRGHWKPYEFAHKLSDFCDLFKAPGRIPPLLGVERNNHGHAVLLELNEHIHYENLYTHSDEKLGWRTDNVSRPIMINAFIDAVENKYLEIQDLWILSECLTLINSNGKIEAADNKHDDCIVATAVALQLCLNSSNLDNYDNIERRILL